MKIFNMPRPSVSRHLREDDFKLNHSGCNTPMVKIKTTRKLFSKQYNFFFEEFLNINLILFIHFLSS
jgi:hypothetical protein